MKALGGDPEKINPLVPVDLIVDHSVQVDYFGSKDAMTKNVDLEYTRNSERYTLIKWAQKSFDNFNVVPPNSGICHQVNLEHLGKVVMTSAHPEGVIAYPDTLVGTDSHTPMINGIGVMGWGVGGIEAEAVMLGQPYYMSIPEVIGVKLTGSLKEGVTATDLVLCITEMLRKQNVVEKFVEYFGPGMKQLPIADRATIANMTPEYGATLGFFPVDEKTVDYLRATGRSDQADLLDVYSRELGFYYTGEEDPEYTQVIEFDLGAVVPSLAGPARPQDRIALTALKDTFQEFLVCNYERDPGTKDRSTFHNESGSETSRTECAPSGKNSVQVDLGGETVTISDGSVVIAAITSCTNTSNPAVMLGAGLMAKRAAAKGLTVPPYVKTSLSPGSRVVTRYLEDAGMMPFFEALGFHLTGYGCMTCIGNSGPLHPAIEAAVSEKDLTVASVLSGNRNFEARIHQKIRGNYLASPMLVVAFALAGRVDIDMMREPLGTGTDGRPVFLKEIFPEAHEIEAMVKRHVKPEFYSEVYADIFKGDTFWQTLPAVESTTYDWREDSTYIRNPPYFEEVTSDAVAREDVRRARVLALLGDSVTTDHISPAGAIPRDYPAGQYLLEKGVAPEDFNSYGSRRGNHEVMMRGTFGNIRIKNRLAGQKEGSYTTKFPDAAEMFIYDAAMAYQAEKCPLVVLGGKEYGTGSSRDWAAKGTDLLGVRAVIAESFERIHRSNLVGMGVLPLTFPSGQGWESLGLDGSEVFDIKGIADIRPLKKLQVTATRKDGTPVTFEVTARLNTEVDVAYFRHGGILPYVLRKLI